MFVLKRYAVNLFCMFRCSTNINLLGVSLPVSCNHNKLTIHETFPSNAFKQPAAVVSTHTEKAQVFSTSNEYEFLKRPNKVRDHNKLKQTSPAQGNGPDPPDRPAGLLLLVLSELSGVSQSGHRVSLQLQWRPKWCPGF